MESPREPSNVIATLVPTIRGASTRGLRHDRAVRRCLAIALVAGCQTTIFEADLSTTGATDASSSDDGGRVPASATCEAYLRCAAAVIPDGVDPLVEQFGPEGTCWTASDEPPDCDATCAAGLAQLQGIADDEPECGTDADGTGGGIAGRRAVDLLFVIDNSASMAWVQRTLAQAMDALLIKLDGAFPPVDYRIGVTTTDSGNPWCTGTSTPAASGALVDTSCLERLSDFVPNTGEPGDFSSACTDYCYLPSLDLVRPWLEVEQSSGGELARAVVRCLIPQGVRGCGFEQPLESAYRAIERFYDPDSTSVGFHRDDALLAVVYVTDEADCSYNPVWETIFMPDGNRVFWSDPDAPAPTSAVCWNAGVACRGGPGVYDDCVAVDRTVDGDLAGSPSIDAVLHPLSRYRDQLQSHDALVLAINGVDLDGGVHYEDALDPIDAEVFGIGPGCVSDDVRAFPPVRIRELIESTQTPENLHSICQPLFDGAMIDLGLKILYRLPPE